MKKGWLSWLAVCVLLFVAWAWVSVKPAKPDFPVRPASAAVREKAPAKAAAADLASFTAAESAAATGAEPALELDRTQQAINDFRRWSEDFTAQTDESQRAARIEEGTRLARARREAMAGFIRKNPRYALQMAAPWAWYRQLPPEVTALLEERVSGRARFDVLCAAHVPGSDHHEFDGCTLRYLHLHGRTYRAYVYGRLVREICRDNMPVHGVAIGDAVALHEDPLRVLGADEAASVETAAASGALPHTCQVCGSPAGTTGRVLAEFGGDLLVFCGEGHAADLNGILAASGGRGISRMGNGPIDPPDNPWTIGVKQALLIRVHFADDTAVLSSEVDAAQYMQEAAEFYARASYGKAKLIPTITPPIGLPRTKLYYSANGPGALMTDAYEAARQAGFNPANYDFPVLHFVPVPNYDWGGLGFVGGPGAWVMYGGSGVIIHEMGHNFGLAHANSANTVRPPLPNPDNGLPYDVNSLIGYDNIYGPGDDIEYGDPFDIMGSGPGVFNPIGKQELGWLPYSGIALPDRSSTNRVYVHDSPTLHLDRHYALAVKKDQERVYWLSARSDVEGNAWRQNGLELHFGGWSQAIGYSQLLDTTPGSYEGKNDAPLTVGRTFSDPESLVHITPIAKGGLGTETYFDVVVNLGPFPGNVPPTLELTPSALAVAPGGRVTFTANAGDLNGDRVSYSWDFGGGAFAGNTATIDRTFPYPGEYVVRCEASDMKGGVTSRHVVITVGSPATFRITGRILDADGNPVANVRVHNGALEDRDIAPSYQWTYTDSDGAFSLVNLAGGSVDLRAFLFGYDIRPLNFTSPLTLAGADAIGVEFLAVPWTRVNVEAVEDADVPTKKAGLFRISRAGDLDQTLRVYFWMNGTARERTDYAAYTNVETQTNVIPTALGSSEQMLPFFFVDFAAGDASTNLSIAPADSATTNETRSVTLTLVYPVQLFRLFVTNTNYVDLPGWEPLTVNGQDTWHQTRPDYHVVPAGTAELHLQNPPPRLPTVSVIAHDDTAVEISTDTLLFAVTRSGALDQPLVVNLQWGGTATPGSDYEQPPTTVTIPAGQSHVDVRIIIRPDSYLEPDETIELSIGQSTAYNAVPGSATATIVDNDMPLVTIRPLDAVAYESDGIPARLLVERAGDSSQVLVVRYLVSGTAISGTDYDVLPGTLTLAAGQTSALLPVTPRNDRVKDGSRTVLVIVSDSPLYNIGPPGIATVTIHDADSPTISIYTIDGEAAEPDNPGSVLIERVGDINRDLVVQIRASGIAHPFEDYAAIGDRVRLPAGVAQVVLPIIPVNDAIREDQENVVVEILSSTNYNVGDSFQAVVALGDDDNGALPGVGFSLLSSRVSEGTGEALVAVSVSADPAPNTDVNIDYKVTGGTAIPGVDYDPVGSTGRLTFEGGGGWDSRVRLITLTLTDNEVFESNRTVVLSLIEPLYSLTNELVTNEITITNELGETETTNVVETNVVVEGVPMNARFDLFPAHTLTIEDDDAAVVSLEATIDEAREQGSQVAILTLTRTGPTNRTQTVHLEITGTASMGTDYQPLVTSVTFPLGLDSIDLYVIPIDDPVQEYTELVKVDLVSAPGATIDNGSATVRIIDNDGTIEFQSTSYNAVEGVGIAQIPVRRTGPTNITARVDYEVQAGSATANIDFVATNGVLNFAIGQAVAYLPVALIDDSEVEDTESVLLSLSNPPGGGPLGGQTTATLLILDDDASLQFTLTEYRVPENRTNGLISVDRTGVATNAVTVEWVLADGTAIGSEDYVLTNGVLTFAAGEIRKTFPVRVLDDALFEGDETVMLTLTNAGANAAIGQQATALLNVVDDECALEFTAADHRVDEYARVLTLGVQRVGGSVNPVSVDFRTVGVTALPGVDFKHVEGTLAFAGEVFVPLPDGSGVEVLQPGVTNLSFQIRIYDDLEGEGHETFRVDLSGPRVTGATALPGATILGAVSNTVVTIADNELPGSVDYEFHPGQGADALVRSVDVQSDGKVLIGGDFGKVNGIVVSRVARLHVDGYLDTFFNPPGGANNKVHAVAVRPDGRIFVGGEFTAIAGVSRNRIARLNADGSIDDRFFNGGGAGGTVRCFSVSPDGSVLVGGDFGSVNGGGGAGVARLLDDGRPDPAFVPTAALGSVMAVAALPDGKVIVGGSQGVLQLNADGSPDGSFNAGAGNGPVHSIAVQADGRIVVVGAFTSFNGANLSRIARLQPDGTLDSSFDPGEGANATIYAVDVQANGRILIGGAFTTYDGNDLNRVARLNPDGSVDSGFDIGSGANNTVRTLVLQPDTAVVIGGDFTLVNGLPRNHVARIHGDDRFVLGRIEFTSLLYSVAEDADQILLTVTRSGDLEQAVQADYQVTPGTASPDEDYRAHNGTLFFTAGQSEAQITVTILDDTIGEGDETLFLTLTNLPPGFDLNGQLSTTLIIRDNESSVGFALAELTVIEAATNLNLRVLRTGAADSAASVDVILSGGTASAGEDYLATNLTLHFDAGQTQAVYPLEFLDDAIEESTETILLALANPTGSLTLGTMSNCTIHLLDNDRIAFYSLNITPPIGGSVTPPSGVYEAGSTQTVAAVPAAEYQFVGWSGTVESSENPLVLVLDQDYTLTARFRPTNPTFTFEEPFAGDDLNTLPWVNASSAPWQLESLTSSSGQFAARSGPINDNQQTSLTLLTETRSGPAAFDFRVSSEQGWDFLEFYLNGLRLQRWSGNVNWQTFHFNIPGGVNRLEWRYSRDANFSSGMDAAFLDNVYVPLVVPPVTNATPAHLTLSFTPQGGVALEIQGTPGGTYVTETSPDLTNWTVLTTNVLEGTNAVVQDPQATNHPARMYRAIGR